MKRFILVGITAAALAVSASTASATTITSSAGSTPTIVANSTHFSWHPGEGTSFLTVTCGQGQFEGQVTSHGSGVPATVSLSKWTWLECGNDTVTTLKPGTLTIESIGSGDGTLFTSGTQIRVHSSEGPVCTFNTSGQDAGTITGGTSATLEIGSKNMPMSGFLCPSIAVLTGDYTITSPSNFVVD